MDIALKILKEALLEALLYWTGEVVLWALTLGHRKPEFDTDQNSYGRVVISGLVGLVAWAVAVIVVVVAN